MKSIVSTIIFTSFSTLAYAGDSTYVSLFMGNHLDRCELLIHDKNYKRTTQRNIPKHGYANQGHGECVYPINKNIDHCVLSGYTAQGDLKIRECRYKIDNNGKEYLRIVMQMNDPSKPTKDWDKYFSKPFAASMVCEFICYKE